MLKVIQKTWTLVFKQIDLSNEVLNINFGQGAAKISEVKVGGQKKISADSARFEPMRPGPAESADIFINLQI